MALTIAQNAWLDAAKTHLADNMQNIDDDAFFQMDVILLNYVQQKEEMPSDPVQLARVPDALEYYADVIVPAIGPWPAGA